MADPVRNQAFDFTITLIDSGNRPMFRTNPTLAAGDFRVSIDEGPLANLATLPVVTPAGSVLVHISLTATEMNGENISVVCRDVAGGEWDDRLVEISTILTAPTITPAPANGTNIWSGLDLVKAALRKTGVLAAGENPTADMTTDAIGELNRVLEAWNIQQRMLYDTVLLTKVLAPGTTQVTIGPGGDINVARPLSITSMYTRVGQLDYPIVSFLTRADYDAIGYKNLVASIAPSVALYDTSYPLATLYLFPPNSGSGTLFISADQQFSAFVNAAQTVAFPPGYADAAIYELGRRKAPEYGRTLDPLFLDQWRQAIKVLKQYNRARPVMRLDPALTGRGGREDDTWILHGGYRG